MPVLHPAILTFRACLFCLTVLIIDGHQTFTVSNRVNGHLKEGIRLAIACFSMFWMRKICISLAVGPEKKIIVHVPLH